MTYQQLLFSNLSYIVLFLIMISKMGFYVEMNYKKIIYACTNDGRIYYYQTYVSVSMSLCTIRTYCYRALDEINVFSYDRL